MFLTLFGYNAGLVDALVYRIVPCFVYDAMLAVILYLFTTRFFRPASTIHHDVMMLR